MIDDDDEDDDDDAVCVETVSESARKASKAKAIKNFNLVSFGDEAEQDEQEVITATVSLGKLKSVHDVEPPRGSAASKDRVAGDEDGSDSAHTRTDSKPENNDGDG